MSASPLVSIITPVYNMNHILNETIQSVIDQTYKNWELILIDDCSTLGETKDTILSWASKDSRIKPIFLHQNGGAGVARNRGLDEVTGKYVAFLDSDDIWLAEKLELQVDLLESNTNIDFVYTWYEVINEKSEVQAFFITPREITTKLLKFNNYILTSTVICRWEKVRDIRMPEIRRRQDWVYFLDILNRVDKAYSIAKSTTQYRKMNNTLSSNRIQLIKPNYQFFRDYLYAGNSIAALVHFMIFIPFYFHNKIFNKRKSK